MKVSRGELWVGRSLLIVLMAITILPFISLFTTALHDVYRSLSEVVNIFQITSPIGGFGGMVRIRSGFRGDAHGPYDLLNPCG